MPIILKTFVYNLSLCIHHFLNSQFCNLTLAPLGLVLVLCLNGEICVNAVSSVYVSNRKLQFRPVAAVFYDIMDGT